MVVRKSHSFAVQESQREYHLVFAVGVFPGPIEEELVNPGWVRTCGEDPS
jgi:hypothetical protein